MACTFTPSLTSREHYDPAFKEAIHMLKGTDTVIWMTLRETKVKGDHDAEAVKLVRDIADLAQASGVRVALYPHAGFYVATAADAARIAKKVERAQCRRQPEPVPRVHDQQGAAWTKPSASRPRI